MQVFLCYARKDLEKWRSLYDLIPFLAESLEPLGAKLWYDIEGIETGGEWRTEIPAALLDSRVAILLVSQAFLNSKYIREVELPAILAQSAKGRLKIVPILAEPCQWKKLPLLEARQFLPTIPEPLINFVRDPAKWSEARNLILGELIVKLGVGDSVPPPSPSLLPPLPAPGRDVEGNLPVSSDKPTRSRRSAILNTLGVAVPAAGLLTFYAVRRWQQSQVSSAFLGALPWLKWIVYDPTDYDPYANRFPSEGSIRADLRVLRRYGLNGLITMSSLGSLREIPRIAHEEGFNMVIAGVWDPRSRPEVAAALDTARDADSFCIGHAGLGKRYTLQEVESTVRRFREQTGRPVAVSELVGDYLTTPRLLNLGDYLFPDVHPSWHEGHKAGRAWEETMQAAERLAVLVVGKAERPILLKMVSFPSGGAAGLTEAEQLAFYRLAVERFRDQNRLPAGTTVSFLSAFDAPWKVAEGGWSQPEQYTGLFTSDRAPKPAMIEVKWEASR